MAWWDHEELKSPADRSDRYIVSFPDEYTAEEVAAAQIRLKATSPESVGSKSLSELIRLAQERYQAMSPEEQQAMWDEQRKSWVRGEMGLDRKGMPGSTTAFRPPASEENTPAHMLQSMGLWLNSELRRGHRWLHKKRGSVYEIVDFARYNSAYTDPLPNGLRDGQWLVLYRCMETREYSVRSVAEFLDGRFVRIHG